MAHVIIGNSAAAVAAVEAIREVDGAAPIHLYAAESAPIYSRCLLSYYLAGHIPEDRIRFRSDDWYDQMRVTPHRGVAVTAVRPDDRQIELADGSHAPYDTLLVAAGARARKLDRPGADLPGVVCLRDLSDAQTMFARCDGTRHAAVLGGGLVGLKAAYALRERGLQVTVVVRSPHLMSQVVDDRAGEVIRQVLEAQGVQVRTGVDATAISGAGQVQAVEMSDGSALPCEMVVVAKGVDPKLELVAGTRIPTHWGIVADDHMGAGAPGVWAAGDVAETADLLSRERAVHALWPNASEQGRVAGFNMAGRERTYAGSAAMNAVEFYGVPIMAVGNVRPRGEKFTEIADYRPERHRYCKLVLREGRLQGLLMVGRIRGAGTALALIKARVEVETVRDLIMSDAFDYAKIVQLVKDHPEAFPQPEFVACR